MVVHTLEQGKGTFFLIMFNVMEQNNQYSIAHTIQFTTVFTMKMQEFVAGELVVMIMMSN